MAWRYDLHKITDDLERTPSGGLRIPAYIARTGVQVYKNPDGSIRREYRPDTEVHLDAALKSFRGAPVTIGHPDTVTPKTWKSLAKGHVGDDVCAEGEHVAATIYVQDHDAVQAVESKKLAELSCGYEVDLDMTPGTTPDGQHYDAVQRNIRGNHVALLPTGMGRAGRDVRLRLDGGQVPPGTEESMKVRINGIEYDTINDQMIQAVAKLMSDLEKQRGVTSAAQARVDELEKQLEEANDQRRIDALVAQRTMFVEQVRKIDANIVTEGRTEEEILREILKSDGTESLDFLRGVLQGKAQTAQQKRADVVEISSASTKRARWTPAPLAANRRP